MRDFDIFCRMKKTNNLYARFIYKLKTNGLDSLPSPPVIFTLEDRSKVSEAK